nr:hypothetical protein CFP56_11566 [Quercus suber]
MRQSYDVSKATTYLPVPRAPAFRSGFDVPENTGSDASHGAAKAVECGSCRLNLCLSMLACSPGHSTSLHIEPVSSGNAGA